MAATVERVVEGIAGQIVAWFRRSARDLPWRRTEDPYGIWVSEVMLQQTQVKTVIPYWERWMRELPRIRSLAEASEERVLKLWEGLGYYSRARNLQKSARLICERHAGFFPSDFREILELPGIGRYTAGAIASIAFGHAAPILDGNVIRVLSRLFALPGNPKSKGNQQLLWSLSTDLVLAAAKKNACSELNQGLMELGATVCLPREPLCTNCPTHSSCRALRAGRVAAYPETVERAKTMRRRCVAFIVRQGNAVLIRKRCSNAVNGGLWEFPNFEPGQAWKERAARLHARHLATIQHTIMNQRITLQALEATVRARTRRLAQEFSAEWRALGDLQHLPFTGAHAKLRALLGTAPESEIGVLALEPGRSTP